MPMSLRLFWNSSLQYRDDWMTGPGSTPAKMKSLFVEHTELEIVVIPQNIGQETEYGFPEWTVS